MTCFKRTPARLMMLATAVGLAGCSFGNPNNRANGATAPLQALPVALTRVETTQTDGLGLPSEKKFYCRVCLRDEATQLPRVGETVTLRTESQVFQKATDSDGCFFWTELFKYRHLAPEAAISLTRTLETSGGNVPVSLVLNPWRNDESALVDLKTGAPQTVLPESEAAQALMGEGAYEPRKALGREPTNLWVSDVSVTTRPGAPTANSERISFSVGFTLEASRKKLEGGVVRETLNQGKYAVHLFLIKNAQNAEQSRVIADAGTAIGEMTAGRLVLVQPMLVPAAYFQKSRDMDLALGYHIEPSGSTAAQTGLLAHSGRIPLGPSLEAVNVTGPGTVDSSDLSSQTEHIELLDPEQTASSAATAGFVLSRPVITFHPALTEDPGTWQAGKSVEIEACVIRNAGKQPMEKGHPFQVQLSDTPEGGGPWTEVKTLESGCLSWVAPVSFGFADRVHYLRKYILVKSEADEFKAAGIVRTQPVCLDPWRQFSVTEPGIVEKGCPEVKAGPAQLKLGHITANKTKAGRFSVDRYYNVKFGSFYEVLFDEANLIWAGDSSIPPADLWKDTRYLLRGVLLAPPIGSKKSEQAEDLSEYEFLSGFETEIRLNDARKLQAQVMLPIDVFRRVTWDTRTRLLLDLVPLSSTGGTEGAPLSTSVVLSFDPHAETNWGDTAQSTLSVSSILEKLGSRLQKRLLDAPSKLTSLVLKPLEMSPADLLLKLKGYDSGVTRVDISSQDQATPGGKIPAKDALTLLDNPATDADQQKQDRILDALRDYAGEPLKVTRFTYLESVEDSPLDAQLLPPRSIDVQAALYKETVDSDEFYHDGERREATYESGEERHRGFDAFGNGRNWHTLSGTNIQKFEEHELHTSLDQIETSGFSRVVSLYVDELRLSLRGDQRRCVLVELQPGLAATGKKSAYLFCTPSPSKDLDEHWYSVTDEYRMGFFSYQDFKNLTDQQLLKVFRGQQRFQAFDRAMEDQTKQYALIHAKPVSPDPARQLSKEFNDDLDRMRMDDEQYPGVNELTPDRVAPAVVQAECLARVRDLIAASGNGGPGEKVLSTYFSVVLAEPERMLGSPAAQARFREVGDQLSAKSPGARTAYLRILDWLALEIGGAADGTRPATEFLRAYAKDLKK